MSSNSDRRVAAIFILSASLFSLVNQCDGLLVQKEFSVPSFQRTKLGKHHELTSRIGLNSHQSNFSGRDTTRQHFARHSVSAGSAGGDPSSDRPPNFFRRLLRFLTALRLAVSLAFRNFSIELIDKVNRIIPGGRAGNSTGGSTSDENERNKLRNLIGFNSDLRKLSSAIKPKSMLKDPRVRILLVMASTAALVKYMMFARSLTTEVSFTAFLHVSALLLSAAVDDILTLSDFRLVFECTDSLS